MWYLDIDIPNRIRVDDDKDILAIPDEADGRSVITVMNGLFIERDAQFVSSTFAAANDRLIVIVQLS